MGIINSDGGDVIAKLKKSYGIDAAPAGGDAGRAAAMKKGADELGIDPVDYATGISYESARSFNPWAKGPVTKWGQHRGTIQYGEPQQKQYGVHPDQTFEDQVTTSNVKYLKDHGVKPGMKFSQIYAAINGGSVNKDLNTLDANTGRTIADNIAIADKEHRPEVIKRFGQYFGQPAGFDYDKAMSGILGGKLPKPTTPPPEFDYDKAVSGLTGVPAATATTAPNGKPFQVPGQPLATDTTAPTVDDQIPPTIDPADQLTEIGQAAKAGQRYDVYAKDQADLDKQFETWRTQKNLPRDNNAIDQFNSERALDAKNQQAAADATFLQQNPKYAEFLHTKNLTHSPEAVDQYNQEIAKVGAAPIQRPVAKTAVNTASDQSPSSTNADLEAENTYRKSQGQEPLTAAQFAANPGGKVDVSIDPNDFKSGNQKLTDLERETPTPDGGTIRYPREVGQQSDNLQATAGVYRSTKGMSEEQATVNALVNAGKGELSPEQATEYVRRIMKDTGGAVGKGGYKPGDTLTVSYEALQAAGMDVKSAMRMDQVQNRLSPEVPGGAATKPFVPEQDAEAALDKRIKEPGYRFQQIASDAVANALEFGANPIGTVYSDTRKLWDKAQQGVDGSASDVYAAEEKQRLLTQHGSYSEALDAENEYQQMNAPETVGRMIKQAGQSYLKNLISGTGKGVVYMANVMEDIAPYATPILGDLIKEIKPTRTVGNALDFGLRLITAPDFNTAYQGYLKTKSESEQGIDKQPLFKMWNAFDDAIGEDRVLKGRFLGNMSDSVGSMAAFMTLGLLTPELSSTVKLGKFSTEFGWAPAIFGGISQSGTGYEQGKQEGLSEDTAKFYGMIQFIGGMTEGFGAGGEVGRLIKNPEIRKNLARSLVSVGKEFIHGGGEEFVQEVTQDVWGNVALNALKREDPTAYDKVINTLKDIPTQFAKVVPNEGLLAFLSAGAFGGAGKAVQLHSSETLKLDHAGEEYDIPKGLYEDFVTVTQKEDALQKRLEELGPPPKPTAPTKTDALLKSTGDQAGPSEDQKAYYKEIGEISNEYLANDKDRRALEDKAKVELGLATNAQLGLKATFQSSEGKDVTRTVKEPQADVVDAEKADLTAPVKTADTVDTGEYIAETPKPKVSKADAEKAIKESTADTSNNLKVGDPVTFTHNGVDGVITGEIKDRYSDNWIVDSNNEKGRIWPKNKVVIRESSDTLEKPENLNTSAEPVKETQKSEQIKPTTTTERYEAQKVNKLAFGKRADKSTSIEEPKEVAKPRPLSNTQIEFSPEQAKPFEKFRSDVIDKADIADKSLLPPYAGDGLNIEPHVTVKYGLHTMKSGDVAPVLAGEKPIMLTLGKTSVFVGADKKIPGTDKPVPYDVVTVEVNSPDLARLNKKLTDKTENTTTFNEYKPHITLAYVKSGEGQKYAGKTDFAGQQYTFDDVTFSPADKSGKSVIPLKSTTETRYAAAKSVKTGSEVAGKVAEPFDKFRTGPSGKTLSQIQIGDGFNPVKIMRDEYNALSPEKRETLDRLSSDYHKLNVTVPGIDIGPDQVRRMSAKQVSKGADNIAKGNAILREIRELVKPDEQVAKEQVETRQKEINGRLSQIDSYVKRVEGLGTMSHLSNGNLKAKYQRAVDIHLAEKAELEKELTESQTPRTPEKDRPESAESDIIQSVAKAPEAFYSQLERTIEQKMPAKASADQVRGIIKDSKSEERDWLGIDQWLDENPNPTKAEVLDFVRAGNVKVEEVVKGPSTDIEAWWNDEGGANEEKPWSELTNAEIKAAGERYKEEVGQYEEDSTKFDQYTLPGGENYRELLLTMPQISSDVTGWTAEIESGDPASGPIWAIRDRHGIWVMGVPKSSKTAAEAIQYAANKYRRSGANFSSSHFDEPNVLAHIRFDDRTVDGKKTLHIAEIQSDFGQALRKEYGKINKAIDENFDSLVKKMEAAKELEIEC